MKSATYLLSAILIATAAFATNASVQREELRILKVVKHTAAKNVSKSQPGPANLPKEERAYMKMRMDAQPHLKPVVTHVEKGEDDENKSL